MTRDERRAEWQAQQDADDAAWHRELEWKVIERTLNALYARLRIEGDSVLLRQRIGRYEALQACLLGSPEALAG